MIILKNIVRIVCIVCVTAFWYLKIKGLLLHADVRFLKKIKEISKVSTHKIIFINRLKWAEHRILRVCLDVYQLDEGDKNIEMFKVLTSLKKEIIYFKNFHWKI